MGTAFNAQYPLNDLETQNSVVIVRAKGISLNRRPLEALQYKSSMVTIQVEHGSYRLLHLLVNLYQQVGLE